MHLHGGRRVDAHDRVVVEVALLHSTATDRDRLAERGGETEHDPAFHLRPDAVGIDDGTAVDRAHDAVHSQRAVRVHGHFGHLRAAAVVLLEESDAAPMT